MDDKCLDDFLNFPDKRLTPVVPDTMVLVFGRLELVLTVEVVAKVVVALVTVVLDEDDLDDLDDLEDDLDDFGECFDGDDFELEPSAELRDGGKWPNAPSASPPNREDTGKAGWCCSNEYALDMCGIWAKCAPKDNPKGFIPIILAALSKMFLPDPGESLSPFSMATDSLSTI